MKRALLFTMFILALFTPYQVQAQQSATIPTDIVSDVNGLFKPGTYRGEIPRPRDGRWVHAFDLIVAEAGTGKLSVKNVFLKGKNKECREVEFLLSGTVNADGSIYLESKTPGCERKFDLRAKENGRIVGTFTGSSGNPHDVTITMDNAPSW